MKNLIIDAANDKIVFLIITEERSYTTTHINSRENFDKFVILLFNFLKKNNVNIKEVNNIFINQGPGKFSGIRASIAAAKALSVTNELNLYGFNSSDLKNMRYENVVNLYEKGMLTKNLINPVYSS